MRVGRAGEAEVSKTGEEGRCEREDVVWKNERLEKRKKKKSCQKGCRRCVTQKVFLHGKKKEICDPWFLT